MEIREFYANFYQNIKDEQALVSYLKAIHREYSKKFKIRESKIIIEDEDDDLDAYINFKEKGLPMYVNKKLVEYYNSCKEMNNQVYPFLLLEIIIHETRHIYQHYNNSFNNLKKDNLGMANNLTFAASRLNNYRFDELEMKIKKAKKYYSKFMVDILYCQAKIEKQLYSYNIPYELDATDKALETLAKVYKSTANEGAYECMVCEAGQVRETIGLGKWFLDEQYLSICDEKDKHLKIIAQALKRNYLDYLKQNNTKKISVQDYTISLYPFIKMAIEDENLINGKISDHSLMLMSSK